MRFSDPELLDPLVHCFARCHWCKNLVPIKGDENGELVLDDRPCPKCDVELSKERLFSSLVENLLHTSAVASANKFISFDLALIPFMGVSVLITFMDFPLWVRTLNLLAYHTPIALCLRWLYKYWYCVRFTDDEYREAVKHMKTLLVLWTAANLVNWTLIILQAFYLA